MEAIVKNLSVSEEIARQISENIFSGNLTGGEELT